jgi:hypothetical protein
LTGEVIEVERRRPSGPRGDARNEDQHKDQHGGLGGTFE